MDGDSEQNHATNWGMSILKLCILGARLYTALGDYSGQKTEIPLSSIYTHTHTRKWDIQTS